MYIVVNGRLRVSVPSADGLSERKVGEVGPGEIVGEFGMVQKPRKLD
jgi:CRP-like cAMP-binding protein